MSIRISVIIPVYKVEKYLQQCVESVLQQSYQNIEVILVDDGSPDLCPQICDTYKEKDKRVAVIHKLNGGLSSARNSGIKKVTGDYTIFLDSDDFWDDVTALQQLVDRIEITKPDVLNYSYKKYYEGSEIKQRAFENKKTRPINLKSKKEQLEYLTSESLFIACAWNKIIRTEILKKGIEFKEGVYSEDIEWCARLFCKADSFDFLNCSFYCYRQRCDSITHTFGEKSCVDLKNNIIACIKIAQNLEDDLKKCLYRYIAYQLSTFIIVQAIADVSPEICIEKLKSYTWILKYHAKNKKVFWVRMVCCIFGFKNVCKIVRSIKNN